MLPPGYGRGGGKEVKTMKTKLKAVAVACLLALQLFLSFLPCTAAGAEESGAPRDHVSFSKTTVYADLVDPEIYAEGKTAAEIKAGEEAAAATLLESYPKNAALGTADASVITSTVETSTNGCNVFFYVYVPGGTESALSAAFTLEAGGRTYYKSAKQVSTTETLVKYRVNLTKSEYESFRVGDSYELTVRLFEITYRDPSSSLRTKTVAYTGQQSSIAGGSLHSDIQLTFSNEGELEGWSLSDELYLDVHLTASRYSTSNLGYYDQINTAMFLIPTEYLEDWKRIDQIKYQYSLLEGVPMLVTECDRDDLTVEGSFFNLWKKGAEAPFAYNVSALGSPTKMPFGKWASHPDAKETFLFMVDQIKTDDKGLPELSDDDVLERYLKLKESISSVAGDKLFAMSDYLRASSCTPLDTYTKTPNDLFETKSFEDSISGFVEWLYKLTGHKVSDDSVSVSAIQIASVGDGTKSDEDLKTQYALDDDGLGTFRSLMNSCVSSLEDQTLVVFHYLKTEYFVHSAEYWREHDQALLFPDWEGFSETTYYCENAIVDDFKIISIAFGENEKLHTVPVVMETMTFIKAPQSPEVVSPIKDDDDPWWMKLLAALKELLQIAALIGAATVLVLIVICVLKLIAMIRDAFGRRGGGG